MQHVYDTSLLDDAASHWRPCAPQELTSHVTVALRHAVSFALALSDTPVGDVAFGTQIGRVVALPQRCRYVQRARAEARLRVASQWQDRQKVLRARIETMRSSSSLMHAFRSTPTIAL